MSARPLWEGYHEAWNDFKQAMNRYEVLKNYIESAEGKADMGLLTATNFLSVGAGSGELEEMIMNISPKLRKMTLLDPDCHQHEALLKRFQNQTNVAVTCLDVPFESYEGPQEGFDLVFMCHCFYHFTDVEHQFARALALVKTGGKLVSVIAQPHIYGSTLAKVVGLSVAPHGYQRLRESVLKTGFVYKEVVLPINYDFTHPGDGYYSRLGVISNKPTTLEKREEFMKEFESLNPYIPGTKIFKAKDAFFIVKKE